MGRGRSPRPPCSLALRWLLMTTLASAVSSSWIPQSRPIPSEADFCGMREYFANDHCCLLCPAGTHVADFCQLPRTLGRCEPCRPGEFTAHPNGLYACRPCKQCHPEDKVTVAPCTRFSDTRCQCKPNHYCELPACEVCLPCRRSCPPGEVVLHKCSQTADTECGPPRAGHTTYSIWSVLGVVAIVVVVVLLIGTVAFFLTSRCRSQLGRGNADQKEPMIPNAKMSLLSKIKEVGLEEFFQSSLSETEQNKIYYLFASKVPPEKWKQFMYYLGLEDNEIHSVMLFHGDSPDDEHFEMLRKWNYKLGKEATVFKALETLVEMGLGKSVDTILSALRKMQLGGGRPSHTEPAGPELYLSSSASGDRGPGVC
ncbi:tumor necrosis factor receptor superfamily member 1A-like isoform X2 [Ornithorhynchus anatinus]|uniref:tumor necrosis factor receptor superfamily member 1A-like isoform X2 n=1 Tax=Ornithorhynchus anatinus TaxID=9258 RepID=UPI0010A8BB23|nr:tumor necrosis factor receptor superfamily member 1A-like isoform X2 [Ornithorhynchus anatinus]